MNNDLLDLLGQLRLEGMAAACTELLTRAERENWGHQQFLGQLLHEELRQRRERSVEYRLSQAKIPWEWTLHTFSFDRQPSLSKTRS